MEEETTPNNQRFSVKKLEAVLVQAAQTKHCDKYYFLSNLDTNFPVVLKLLHYYKPNKEESNENAAIVIKESLSKVLSYYYPLADTLMIGNAGKYIVKCTNKGAAFVEAEADCEIGVLGESSKVPDLALLGNLIHTQQTSILNLPLLSVQVTRFNCGGFVVGTVISHMVDGPSMVDFMKSCGEAARGLPKTTPVYLDRRVLESRKPPLIKYTHDEYDETDDISGIEDYYQKEKNVREAITFDRENLNRLKEDTMREGDMKNCTSFTILTALIWRERCKALKMKPDQIAKLFIYVDGRLRSDYSLPEGYFGNTIHQVSCSCLAGELMEKPLCFAVETVQKCLKRVTWDYIKSANDYLEVNRNDAKISFKANLFVNSWMRTPFHSVDFGWGEADKFISAIDSPKEYIVFLPVRGNEISLLMWLPETAMETFKTLVQLTFGAYSFTSSV